MKKMIFSSISMCMALSLIVGSVASADGGDGDRWRPPAPPSEEWRPTPAKPGDKKEVSLGEFLCAIAGGAAVGTVGHKVSAGNPIVTFFGALIGGVIGNDFCKYLDSEDQQGLKEAAEKGLRGDKCKSTYWEGKRYKGFITPLCESWHTGSSAMNQNVETGIDNKCIFFETTIYEKRTGRFIKNPRAWACLKPHGINGTWVVTNERWVRTDQKGPVTCDALPSQNHFGGENNGRWQGGTVGIGEGPDRYERENPPVTVRPVPGACQGSPCAREVQISRTCHRPGLLGVRAWSVEGLRRQVNDGVYRGYRIATLSDQGDDRTGRNDVIIGYLQSVSDDGQYVTMYKNPRERQDISITRLGLECLNSVGICNFVQVNGALARHQGTGEFFRYNGLVEFLFRDGGIVLNDPNWGWIHADNLGCGM